MQASYFFLSAELIKEMKWNKIKKDSGYVYQKMYLERKKERKIKEGGEKKRKKD